MKRYIRAYIKPQMPPNVHFHFEVDTIAAIQRLMDTAEDFLQTHVGIRYVEKPFSDVIL